MFRPASTLYPVTSDSFSRACTWSHLKMTLELEVFHMILSGAWLGAAERRKGGKEATSKLVNKQQHQEQAVFFLFTLRSQRREQRVTSVSDVEVRERHVWTLMGGMWKWAIRLLQSHHIRGEILFNWSKLYRYHCVNVSKNRLHHILPHPKNAYMVLSLTL